MKNIVVKGMFLGVLLILITSCNTNDGNSSVVPVNKDEIKKEIQARENEFAEIYNTGEVKNIGYYADDAITYYQNMPPITTKKERLDFLQIDQDSNNTRISFTTTEVFPSKDGSQVLEIGYYSVVDSTNTAINTGNYMSLFEKRDGKYVCLRDMSASDMP